MRCLVTVNRLPYRPVSNTSQMVHNGGSPDFQVLLFNKNTSDMVQIFAKAKLQGMFYNINEIHYI